MSSVSNTVFRKVILGVEVNDHVAFGATNGFCDTYSFVRNGHELCGDSLFVNMEHDRVIIGIFDGVSTENGAAASYRAAMMTRDRLMRGKLDEERIVDTLTSVHDLILEHGMTTAAVACIEESGNYYLGSIGDSPIYLREHGQKQMRLMLDLDKVVEPGQDIQKYEEMRKYITAGLGDPPLEEIHTQTGVISSGAVFLLCSDGLSDCLGVPFHSGIDTTPRVQSVDDTSDLSRIIHKLKKPQSIVTRLVETLDERIQTGEKHLWLKNTMLSMPTTDDVAAIALRWL